MKFDTNLEGMVWEEGMKVKRQSKREPALLYADFNTVKAFWNGSVYTVAETLPDIYRMETLWKEVFLVFGAENILKPLGPANMEIKKVCDAVRVDDTAYLTNGTEFWQLGTEQKHDAKQLIMRLGSYFSQSMKKVRLCYSTGDGHILDAFSNQPVSMGITSRIVESITTYANESYKVQDRRVFDFANNLLFDKEPVIEICIYKGRLLASTESGSIIDVHAKELFHKTSMVVNNMLSASDSYMNKIRDQLEEE